jgi:phospholipid/cholesterol/gamma-HCH transport system permease protein
MTIRGSTSRWDLTEATLALSAEAGGTVIAPAGDWVLPVAGRLESLVAAAGNAARRGGAVVLDLGGLGQLDTAGALILNRLLKARDKVAPEILIRNASDAHRVLVEEVHGRDRQRPPRSRRDGPLTAMLLALGHVGVQIYVDLRDTTGTLGAAAIHLGGWLVSPRRIRVNSCARQLQRMAIEAIPIVALMSFLIGAIIAQQGAFYFRRFGAELYVVDMSGVLALRELGVLLTAIMVAGRTGSSITAEIGSMKMREEVDALRVIGLDPIEVLVLPRLIALIIAMPALTLLSDFCAVIGAALVSVTYVDLPIDTFIFRMKDAIDLETLLVGLIKAPFMATVIGLIACVEGLQVKGSAESLGEQTTIAVVKSIFMVIVLDGFFAVFFASAGI